VTKTAFADTAYWVALLNPRDPWHQQARDASRVFQITLLAFFSAYGSAMRRSAVELVRELLQEPHIEVLSLTRGVFLTGLELYEQRLDKEYSLVDCVSMQVMRQRGLTDALTHDRHFVQEGFAALLRDP
jgi:predicted nucleic acid-binding protein